MHINPVVLTCPHYFALKQAVEAPAFLFKEIFNLFHASYASSKEKLDDHSVTFPASVFPPHQTESALGRSALASNMQSTVRSFYSDSENIRFSAWLGAYQKYAVTRINMYI